MNGGKITDVKVLEALAQLAQQRKAQAEKRHKLWEETKAFNEKLIAPLHRLMDSDERLRECKREIEAVHKTRKLPSQRPALELPQGMPRPPLSSTDSVQFITPPYSWSDGSAGGTADKASGELHVFGNNPGTNAEFTAVGFVYHPPTDGLMSVTAPFSYQYFVDTDAGTFGSANAWAYLYLQIMDISLPWPVGSNNTQFTVWPDAGVTWLGDHVDRNSGSATLAVNQAVQKANTYIISAEIDLSLYYSGGGGFASASGDVKAVVPWFGIVPPH